MSSRPLRFATIGICSAALLAACDPAPVEPSVSPVPSASSATPVDPYQEAERVYRRIDWLNNRYVYSGIYQFPNEMEELATGPYISQLREFYESASVEGLQHNYLEKATFDVRPFVDDGGHGADVVLRSCSDYRPIEIIKDGKVIGHAALRYERWYFKYEDDKLKLFGIKTQEVETCNVD